MDPRTPASPEVETDGDGAAFNGVTRPDRMAPVVLSFGAAILVGLAILTRSPNPVIDPPESPTMPRSTGTITSPAPALVPAIAPAHPLVPPSLDPNATPWPIPEMAAVDDGPATVRPAGAAGPRVTFALTGGGRKAGSGWYMEAAESGTITASVGAWAIERVHDFPCRWAAGEIGAPHQSRTAEGLAHALAAWWGQDPDMPADSNSPIAPIATTPTSGTMSGYPAWYLEILVPSDFDLAACDGGQLILWEARNGEARYALGPGELIRVSVVDIPGGPIVIEGSTFIGRATDRGAEIAGLARSAVIDR